MCLRNSSAFPGVRENICKELEPLFRDGDVAQLVKPHTTSYAQCPRPVNYKPCRAVEHHKVCQYIGVRSCGIVCVMQHGHTSTHPSFMHRYKPYSEDGAQVPQVPNPQHNKTRLKRPHAVHAEHGLDDISASLTISYHLLVLYSNLPQCGSIVQTTGLAPPVAPEW